MALNRIKNRYFGRPVDKVRYRIISHRIADNIRKNNPGSIVPLVVMAASIISIMII